MLKITYVGPHSDGVEVPDLGCIVDRGETIEVDDDVTALNLLDQSDNWQAASPSAASKKRHELRGADAVAGDPPVVEPDPVENNEAGTPAETVGE